MTVSPQNIALFGTSADPPTLGHQKIIHWLSRYYDLVVVWVANNPSKQHQVCLATRNEMFSLFIDELSHSASNVLFCPNISDRKTYNTIIKAKSIWADAEFTLIVGSDVIKQIKKWYQIDRIVKQVKVLILPRISHELTSSDLENLQLLRTRYSIAKKIIPNISSSQYRDTKDRKLLTPAIEKYLQLKQLY